MSSDTSDCPSVKENHTSQHRAETTFQEHEQKRLVSDEGQKCIGFDRHESQPSKSGSSNLGSLYGFGNLDALLRSRMITDCGGTYPKIPKHPENPPVQRPNGRHVEKRGSSNTGRYDAAALTSDDPLDQLRLSADGTSSSASSGRRLYPR